ncbi:unnamed protein product [Arctogadus glacialis]
MIVFFFRLNENRGDSLHFCFLSRISLSFLNIYIYIYIYRYIYSVNIVFSLSVLRVLKVTHALLPLHPSPPHLHTPTTNPPPPHPPPPALHLHTPHHQLSPAPNPPPLTLMDGPGAFTNVTLPISQGHTQTVDGPPVRQPHRPRPERQACF